LMNAMRPIPCTTATLTPTVSTLLEALCVHAVLDTLGMVSAAVSSTATVQSIP